MEYNHRSITQLEPIYKEASRFEEGLAKLKTDTTEIWIDTKGNVM